MSPVTWRGVPVQPGATVAAPVVIRSGERVQILYWPGTRRIRVMLPLPPSTNARLTSGKRLTPEARAYLRDIGTNLSFVRKTLARLGYRPMSSWTWVGFWFVLPRTACDVHNYFKVLCDALNEGWLVTDDRYIYPDLQGVGYDPKAPCVVLEWTGAA